MTRFRPVGSLDQVFLLPPDVRDWLPADHLAWFVIGMLDELDVSQFEGAYRQDGQGRAAYPPKLVLGVLLLAYAQGVTSSREIERRCLTDIAFRVVACQQRPDHATISRFRRRHRDAIGELFGQVVRFGAEHGYVTPQFVAVDGTKLAADASPEQNRDRLADDIVAWLEASDATDDSDDDRFGSGRGDELPAELADPEQRARLLAQWLAEQEADEAGVESTRVNLTDPQSRLQPRTQGGGRWVQGYNAQAATTSEYVIVAVDVVPTISDRPHLEAMVAQARSYLCGSDPSVSIGTLCADAGYWSADHLDLSGCTEVLIAPVKASRLPEPNADVHEPASEQPPDPPVEDEAGVVARQRAEMFERVRAGELTQKAAGVELGICQQLANVLYHRYLEGGIDAIRWKKRPNGRGLAPKPTTKDALARAEMLDRLADPDARKRYKQRSATIECIFAILRTRGHGRLRLRGLAGARTEWQLIAISHNLTRYKHLAGAI